ncbi:aspartyl aminopeptidase [Rhizomicrobium palustre]|uniref:M18 family aminopeptidase n=1 Tax=Rhizomicrobium palustre TaxID=189966 RepID=A0A846MVK2_9PROT|nr:aspartyl aminopeptidase [Rhizomicrobium palustre]
MYPERFLAFLEKSASPYHAVAECAAQLTAAGFTELAESARWQLEPGKGYFVVRGGKAILAWRQGLASAAEEGVRIIVAHTDSPVLKVRPRPDMKSRNLRCLTTEIYGGPLLYTWLDRDLKLTGALYCGETAIERVLVDLDELPVRAVSLAIHLRQDKGSDTYTFEREKDFAIVVGDGETAGLDLIHNAVTQKLGRDPGPILSFDLELNTTDKPKLVGENGRLISAQRLDNLFSCYTALTALIENPAPTSWTNAIALYDSEEIGSRTHTGAQSNTMDGILHRIVAASGTAEEDIWRAKARSVVISADMAHSEHPAFVSATDPVTVPELNKGLALKSGAMGNYAIAPGAEAWFSLTCKKAGVPLQRFRYRCDHGRGSSIGPIMTTVLGITGIDVGSPMLAMHSAREMAGAEDLAFAIHAFAAAFTTEEKLPV